MSDLVAEFGAALCSGIDAVGALGPSLCADDMGRTVLGYSLVLVLGALMLGLLTIEPATVSTFVRLAIEERMGLRQRPSAGAHRTGRRH